MHDEFIANLQDTPADQLIDAFALYLQSLGSGVSGQPGPAGSTGPAGPSVFETWLAQPENAGKSESDFLFSLRGPSGDSVLDIWHLAGGFGTEQDFINSLSTQNGLRISSIRNLTAAPAAAPKVLVVTDPRRAGTFLLDSTDTTTADDGGLTIVTNGGCRYKRNYTGPINAKWFGALGISNANAEFPDYTVIDTINTDAIQAAIDAADKATGQSSDQLIPQSKGVSNTVLLPSGTYYLYKPLKLKGTVHLVGERGGSYGSVVLRMRNEGTGNVIELAPSAMDNVSNAAVVESIRFIMTNGVESSAIYSAAGFSFHSLRVEDCWFQIGQDSPNQRAYVGLQADDVKFIDCTFDGTGPSAAIILGQGEVDANMVSNFTMQNCTIYKPVGTIISARNVDGLLVTGCRVYGIPSLQGANFVDALTSGATRANLVQIETNQFTRINNILSTKFDGFILSGNQIRLATKNIVNLGPVNIYNARCEGNIISGTWAGTLTVGGTVYPDAPFITFGTNFYNSVFDNTITNIGSASPIAYYLPGGTGNVIHIDQVTGFTLATNAPTGNIVSQAIIAGKLDKAANLGDVLDLSTAQANLGFGGASMAQQVSTNVSISGGTIAGVTLPSGFAPNVTVNANTTTWSTSTFTQLVAPGVLTVGAVYLVKVRLNMPTVDAFTQIFLIPIEQTAFNSAGNGPEYTSDITSYGASLSTTYFCRIRPKKPASGMASVGLEIIASNANMLTSDTVATITLIKIC